MPLPLDLLLLIGSEITGPHRYQPPQEIAPQGLESLLSFILSSKTLGNAILSSDHWWGERTKKDFPYPSPG